MKTKGLKISLIFFVISALLLSPLMFLQHRTKDETKASEDIKNSSYLFKQLIFFYFEDMEGICTASLTRKPLYIFAAIFTLPVFKSKQHLPLFTCSSLGGRRTYIPTTFLLLLGFSISLTPPGPQTLHLSSAG